MSALFATTYIIDNYDFIFEGNTDVSMVYTKLGIKDYTSFDSYEELEAHVRSKEQEIANWDIFNETDSMVVELDGGNEEEKHYTAVFEINDKSPIFIFPTPKYDSNTGISMGIRMDSKNFMGKLAKLTTKIGMDQTDNTFKNADYSLIFNLSSLPIGNVMNMDTTLEFSYSGSAKSFLQGTKLTLGNSFYGIKLGDVSFSFSDSLVMNPTEDDISSFGVSYFYYTASFGNLLPSLGGFSFNNTLYYYPRSQLTYTYNTLSYGGLKLRDKTVSLSLSATTYKYNTSDNLTLIISESASVPFYLPFGFTFTPGLSFSSSYTYGETDMHNWSVSKSLTASASLSFSRLNRDIDGNQDFRKGISFSLYGNRSMPITDFLTSTSQYATLSITWFPFATSWINPSVRVLGIVSQLATNSPIYPYTSTSYLSYFLAEYMRGIRNDNENNYGNWNTIMVANINITTKCINLGSWARTYAIPFVDVAFLSQKDQDPKWLSTVGIEGIGIINNHSNYPVRASLGFNTESIKKFAETKEFDDLEWELFFGLGFFY